MTQKDKYAICFDDRNCNIKIDKMRIPRVIGRNNCDSFQEMVKLSAVMKDTQKGPFSEMMGIRSHPHL